MEKVADDSDAWYLWPRHRNWFNKLEFSIAMGYDCGPCGTAPTKSGFYVVRPIYNLNGMGVGARKEYINKDDYRRVEPGYFWCEWFEGKQHSVTYEWHDGWKPVSSWYGVNNPNDLSRFLRWEKAKFYPEPPLLFDSLKDVGLINVEWIGKKPIEVHLRPSPDPQDCDMIIPVWSDAPVEGYEPYYDDAEGFLKNPRLGFIIIKNN
jgi:hypothetical protein